MDEGEKPFPIELIVILMVVAIANDIAEICFDLLDFTGVGIAGEGIMEPANLALDLFFTAIFWWKVGPGGGTITQYIGDLLEPFLIPGRTISVGVGIWVANHPSSSLSKIANTSSAIEGGNIEGELNEGEKVGEAINAEKKVQNEEAAAAEASGKGGQRSSPATPGGKGEEESPENEAGEENKNAAGDAVFANPLDNPVGTAGEEAFNPAEDQLHEGTGFKSTAEEQKQDDASPKTGIHLVPKRPPSPAIEPLAETEGVDEEKKAA